MEKSVAVTECVALNYHQSSTELLLFLIKEIWVRHHSQMIYVLYVIQNMQILHNSINSNCINTLLYFPENPENNSALLNTFIKCFFLT